MNILGKIFGSIARVRILRLFFLNPEMPFTDLDVAHRTETNPATARREIALLKSIDVVKKTKFKREFKKKGRIYKKTVSGWALDGNFPHGEELKNFLVNTDVVKKDDILKRFRRAGNIKVLIIAGIFIEDDSSRADVFIVGDRLKKAILERAMKALEAEVGKELSYVAIDTKDLRYRLEFHDRFVRDILDYPHETIIDKIGLS